MSMLISSCQNRPKEVLNRKRMEQLMYDVYIAEATIDNDLDFFDSPEKKEAYINKVFSEHNVTQTQWDTSLSWYSDRIDLYLKMNDSVKTRIKRVQTEVESKIRQINIKKSEQNLEIYSKSNIPRVYTFKTPGAHKNGFSFHLDSTEISRDIPDNFFSFNLNVIGKSPFDNSNLRSALILVYSDTTIYKLEHLNENRNYGIPVSKYIYNDTLTQIYGFVHLESMPGINPNIQLYDIYFGSQ